MASRYPAQVDYASLEARETELLRLINEDDGTMTQEMYLFLHDALAWVQAAMMAVSWPRREE